jgi:hypothetical protein
MFLSFLADFLAACAVRTACKPGGKAFTKIVCEASLFSDMELLVSELWMIQSNYIIRAGRYILR